MNKFPARLIASCLLIVSFGLTPECSLQATQAIVANRLKTARWHPGHYFLTQKPVASALPAGTKFRGIQRMYAWKDLEPSNGQYNFQAIRTDLRDLKLMNKHLVVQIQTKTFGDTGANEVPKNYCPSDLKGSPNPNGGLYGATYLTSSGSLDPAYWDDAVNNRLNRLYVAMGRQLASDPNIDALEALNLPETAISVTGGMPGHRPHDTCMPYDETKYVQNLTAGAYYLNQAFPHTVVFQYTNFPTGTFLSQMASNLNGYGIGLGCPDLNPFNSIHPGLQAPSGVYAYYEALAGSIPLGISVQTSDYYGGGSFDATVKADYEFGRDRLKVNYIFWQEAQGYQSAVTMLSNPQIVPQKDPAGGLTNAYPRSVAPYLGQ